MDTLFDALSWICLVAGGLFAVCGGVGVLRLPDLYTRMHAAGVTDTMGAGLVLLGLMFQAGMSLALVKLALILWMMLITSPTSTHALVKSAIASGLAPLVEEREDEPS
jgi:multicomponent Na+:H+ antiporter subunit G